MTLSKAALAAKKRIKSLPANLSLEPHPSLLVHYEKRGKVLPEWQYVVAYRIWMGVGKHERQSPWLVARFTSRPDRVEFTSWLKDQPEVIQYYWGTIDPTPYREINDYERKQDREQAQSIGRRNARISEESDRTGMEVSLLGSDTSERVLSESEVEFDLSF